MIKILIPVGLVTATFITLIATSGNRCKAPQLLKPGMTADQVVQICGKPSKINGEGFNPADGQWVYPNGFPNFGGDYLYFNQGQLKSIQWEH